jgi:hypothetical protein
MYLKKKKPAFFNEAGDRISKSFNEARESDQYDVLIRFPNDPSVMPVTSSHIGIDFSDHLML